MKLLKRMAVLSLVVLALGGCTKSSISTDAPVSGSEEVDPAKMETDDVQRHICIPAVCKDGVHL